MKNFLMITILVLGLGFMGCTRDDDAFEEEDDWVIEEEEYIDDSEEVEEEKKHIENPADIVEDLIF